MSVMAPVRRQHPWNSNRTRVTIASLVASCTWVTSVSGMEARYRIERIGNVNAILILCGPVVLSPAQVVAFRKRGKRGQDELRSLVTVDYSETSRGFGNGEGGSS